MTAGYVPPADPAAEALPAGGRAVRRLHPRAAAGQVRGWLRAGWLGVRRVGSTVRLAWQSSIALRVVAATLALSVVVVSLLGATLVRQITAGLLEAQREAAVADVTAGIADAQRRLDAAEDVSPTGLGQLLTQVVQDLASPEGRGGGTYDVVLMGRSGPEASAPSRPTRLSGDVEISSVPAELRTKVRSEPRIWHTYTEIVRSDGSRTPGLAVGGQVVVPTLGSYELYYLFPLDDEAATLDLVRNGLATAGILLVLLLGAIAWLVVRQVVDPVRAAARTAEEFSAGRLQERMAVRGRDDLAKLAASFNQMAESLQQQIRQLEDMSRMQRQFVSDVSHELRTPLTTVRMAADVLHESRDQFDPAVARSAELLQTQLDRFEALLSDLLEISRFDSGAAVLELEDVDVRDVIHSAVDAAAPLAAAKGSEIVLRLPHSPAVAALDPRRIERVLRNLIVNAIEHGEGRPIVITARANDDAVAVAVRDHGVGLKPGEAALVFNRFWRGDPARSRTTGGTGLGLSIALEDARLHRGWLQAWGEPGDGSQFRLTLPRRRNVELTGSPIPLVPADAVSSRGLARVGAFFGARA
jgi:two-component system, OmpR family, sensor histidine kinase MtrB